MISPTRSGLTRRSAESDKIFATCDFWGFKLAAVASTSASSIEAYTSSTCDPKTSLAFCIDQIAVFRSVGQTGQRLLSWYRIRYRIHCILYQNTR